MNIQTVNLNGQTIRVCIKEGKPNVTPLLIMTGIGASLELLTPFVEAMHASNLDMGIITFDYPGVSGSSTPLLPYRFSGLARTISQMLDCLDIAQVNVLGLSWGGFISQQFAHDYPQRCKKLILAATCSGVLAKPPSMKVLGLMASPRRYTDPEYAASIAADIYGGKFRSDNSLAARHAERMSQSKSAGHSQLGYTYQQMALWGWSSLLWLHNIKQPTLVLAGNDDPLMALCNMEMLNNRIPNSEMYVFNDGHLFLLTSIDEVMPIVCEFLENK